MRKFIAALVFVSPLLFTGCESEGPMEEAGENVDETVEETEEAVE